MGRAAGRRRSPLAAGLLAVALLAGCTSSPVTPSPAGTALPSRSLLPTPAAATTPLPPAATPSLAPAAPVSWSDCGGGFQCGKLDVPLDYADPAGPIVRLELIRLPASEPATRIGSLVVNPGGPGGSGVDFVRSAATSLFAPAIRARFDIVGFDPRGVGLSTPVRCVDELDHPIPKDAHADTAADVRDLMAEAQAFARGCESNNPELLPHLSTLDTARDLDRVREAVGDTALTYVGFSYGTMIGSTYASLFPRHIRAMVLDGAIDPGLDAVTLREEQARAFEAALGRFLADCAADPACAFHSGGRPGPAFDALMKRIDRTPVPTPRLDSREPVGPTQAWDGVLQALYSRDTWPLLAEALADARDGDGSLLLLLGDPLRGRRPDGGYSNLEDAYYATTCLDWPAPRDPAAYTALASRLAGTAPRFGPLVAYNDLDCAYWPVPAERVPAPVAAPGAPPIVIVGSTGDPATPYAWSESLARQLTSSVLVTRVGEGHTGYGSSRCVESAVDAYLLRLTPPRDGLRCR